MSTFNFRVKDKDGYKAYSHLSDTINLKAFHEIIEKNPTIFSSKDIDYVNKSYLSQTNLKKIDVGGGAIHGHLQDYENDESRKYEHKKGIEDFERLILKVLKTI